MRYIKIIFFSIFFVGCKSNSQKGYEIFKQQLSQETITKIANNSPYPLSDKVVADYRYYPYFQEFGNSGISVEFNIPKEDEKTIKEKLKSYKYLETTSIFYNDTSYVYFYKDSVGNIEIPELSEEMGELSHIKLSDESEVEVYVIDNGKLANAFVDGDNMDYNYSIGIYYYKKRSTLIYWFLLFQ